MAITVPTIGSEIDVITFGKPVVDAINGMAPTAWTLVTGFQNGWINFDGTQLAAYRKIGDVVYMRGVIKNGTVPSAAFTLPVGFRPPMTYGLACNSNESPGILNVRATGEVIMQLGSPVYFWLSGIIFSTV